MALSGRRTGLVLAQSRGLGDGSMHAERVCNALHMAISQRQPAPGLVVHSDRGSQYASARYQALLAEHGFVCRMRRKGNCWDNAVAERFFLNLRKRGSNQL